MVEVSLRVGLAGCVAGVLMSFLGVIWSIVASRTLEVFPVGLVTWWGGALRLYVQSTYFSLWFFLIFTIVFGAFLILTGLMVGVGFYGFYKLTGRPSNLVGVVSGIILPLVAFPLMLMSSLSVANAGMGPYFPPTPNTFTYVLWFRPDGFYLGLSFVLLAAFFSTLGVTLYLVRSSTTNPSLSSNSGKISLIVGGLLLIAVFPLWGPLIFGSVAFILASVLFITLYTVYHSSLSLIPKIKGKPSPKIQSAKPAEGVTTLKAEYDVMKKEEDKIFVKCPFCGAEVEKDAPSCPKCGGVLL